MDEQEEFKHVIQGSSFRDVPPCAILSPQEESEKREVHAMKTAATAIPNELLSYERERRHWTQEYVAEQIGAPDPKMVGKWERGIILPTAHYRQQLITLFGKSARELGLVRRDEIPFWNVPYRRNLFFTGREDLLEQLHTALNAEKTAAFTHPQALSGLGGVGKTQIAIEYTYRYAHTYQTVVWMRADSIEVLTSDFAAIATLLNLPEKDEQAQSHRVAAVKGWFAALTRWLLVFDNVDDLSVVQDFLPVPCAGHILLTTRIRATGRLAHSIEVEPMAEEDGASFLLRRCKLLARSSSRGDLSETDYTHARAIAQTLGGLPLALDQAGAYIEETACSLASYHQLYQTQRQALLQWRGEPATADHPDSVATTWSLSFERIQHSNVAATELLCLFAFLAPDAIPEEIITDGAAEFGPTLQAVAADPLALNVAIRDLRKFSLVHRDPDAKILTIHRLVQAVLRDKMNLNTQRLWSERAVRAVSRAFPGADFELWGQCERCLPHAQVCVGLIQEWNMLFPEAARLLEHVGNYLREQGQFAQAETFYQRALAIQERTPGQEDLDLAQSLQDLGILYYYQGKRDQAGSVFQRALTIREKILGAEHPDVAQSLNDLAVIHYYQRKYAQAEALYQRAILIRQQAVGLEHPDMAESLVGLAFLYFEQGRYAEAEPLYQRALSIDEKRFGMDHPALGAILLNLAALYRHQGRYAEAEPLCQRAIAIWEQTGPEHPDVAFGLRGLGRLYVAQGQYDRAEPLYWRALGILENALGPENLKVADALVDLAELYAVQDQYAQAEPLYRRALAVQEKALGLEHYRVAETLNSLAQLYAAQGLHDRAEPLVQRVAMINRQAQVS
jgi:tetratricopeptide (TPR) repeat protein/transcriptional regulator with XRE-family HTH domain